MNKKIIYIVGIKQNLEYNHMRLFKKSYITQEWIIRNIKYIYATSPKEAIEKYNHMFYQEYESISGWGDWYDISKNIDMWALENKNFIKTINQEVIIVEENYFPKNIKILKTHMSAYDFRDWWHDYENDDITEVLNNN